MYLHLTVVKMHPEQVPQACQAWAGMEHSAISGLRQALLVESLDEPGRITWLSLWDSLGEARAFLTSPAYAE
jgi:heme-degrading monooxygenase HmoA